MDEQGEAIHINPEEIPKFRVRELVQCVLDMMEDAFSDPAMEERYQQWLIGYRERKRQSAVKMKVVDKNGVLLDLP